MSASLVGSEMCIRDSSLHRLQHLFRNLALWSKLAGASESSRGARGPNSCLLYTSDAADDM
eukprot:8613613-Alexandrium_andersonii.AAC.1